MFTTTFNELKLSIEGQDFSVPLDGQADIADAFDRAKPAVLEIRLTSDNGSEIEVPKTSPLFQPLADAIMASCKDDIDEQFERSADAWEGSVHGRSFADEHRLGARELV